MKDWFLVISEQKLFVAGTLVFILAFLGVVFVIGMNNDDEPNSVIPSPSPVDYSFLLNQSGVKPEVAGVTKSESSQNSGPEMPEKKPSPSPSPSPKPSPEESPSPSPSPIPSENASTKPAAPSNIILTAGCDGSNPKIDIKWEAVNEATAYKIYRDDTEIKEHMGTWYEDKTGLEKEKSYSYYVQAVNKSVESDKSESKSATTHSCS